MSELEALPLQVAQRLGRCVMRIQRYELLWKALLQQLDASWTSDGQRAIKGKPIAKRTLGELVRKFQEDHLDGGQAKDDRAVGSGDDACAFRMGVKFQMSPAQWDSLVAPLDGLIDMRNELVHHLIERFDVATAAGCYEAIKHLKDCFERIGVHFTTLQEFAISFNESRRSFLDSKEFQSWLEQVEEGAKP